MVPSPRQEAAFLQTTMEALHQARLLVRQAEAIVPDGVTLGGQPADKRLGQVAELLHLYTVHLRRLADE